MPFSRLFGLAAQKRRGKFFFRAGNQKSTRVHFEIPFQRRIARPDRWSIRIQSTPIVCSSLTRIDTKCGRYCPGTGLMRIVSACRPPRAAGADWVPNVEMFHALVLSFFIFLLIFYCVILSYYFRCVFQCFPSAQWFFVLLSASSFSIPLPSVYCGFLLTNLSDSVVFQ